MKCVLVFDHLNDVLFSKCDRTFLKHIYKLARNQGADLKSCEDENADLNYLIQLFSPIVTSQRVMSSQFGNSYRSIQCQDGINMVFEEYMGYLFVCVGLEEINWLKRMLGISISIIQHLCGPDVSILKVDESRSDLVSRLMETWTSLVDEDQSVLVEALEQLTVNTELSTAAITALSHATDKIKNILDYPKCHAVIFVENKFLALYSSKPATELSASDILFLSLLVEGLRVNAPISKHKSFQIFTPKDQSSDDEFYSPESSPEPVRKNGHKGGTVESVNEGLLHTELVLLAHGGVSAVVPHVVHIAAISPGVSLLLIYQRCSEGLSIGLHEALDAGTAITTSASSDSETLKYNMERLDSALKKLFDNLKKVKPVHLSPKVDATSKVIHSKWEVMKKQWKETGGEGCVASLVQFLRQLLQSGLFLDRYQAVRQAPQARTIAAQVSSALQHFTDFLQVKALRNFTLGSRASLSINKYLEEFPALVHFMYIDRTNHRITAPTIDFECKNTVDATKKKIWAMVEFSRTHLQEGHLALMWKDMTFNYGYYLWFEDNSGTPVKPKVSPVVVVKSLGIPGVISSNFYEKLVEGCFPKGGGVKVRCVELYLVHLGQVTSPLVLDHSRRLAATIWEVTGFPHNPLDLL